MEGLSGPQEAGAWRFRQFAFAAALIVGLFAAVLLSPAPAAVTLVFTGIGLVGGSLAMAAGFRRLARLSTGRRRRAWTLVAVAASLAAVSNLLLITSAAASPHPNRTPSDAALVLALVAGAAGLANFPLAKRRPADLTRMILDGTILGGSSLFVVSVTLFPRILENADGSSAFSLVVPVADVVIATVATLLFFRGAPQDRPILGLAAAGFICYTVSDFIYAVQFSAQGGAFTFGSATDLGWIIGYALIALATRSPGSDASPAGESPVERSPVAGTVVMFTLFGVAAVLILVKRNSEDLTPASAALWVVVLLAVMARQILLVLDNEQLRRGLEQLVDERTRLLNQVSQQSDLLLTSVGDGIYGVDRTGEVTFVNPAAARALGYSANELIGRKAHATFHDNQPDGTPFPVQGCYITEAIQSQKVASGEEDNYRRADGLSIPVEVTATPLVEEGLAIGAVVVFRDVTQRREVDRMKSEFVSMVSHELRTPLTAIRGSLGLIAGGALGELSPSAAHMVDIALVSSERLSRLINQILDIERIESGMQPMDLATHRAKALVKAAVGQVQVLAAEAGVRVSVGRTEGLVYADADRVVQTLLNLLGNAIKFSHPGGRVSVRSRSRGAFVEFAIRDDGRGIPEDKLDRIFSRFEQVDSSDAREKGGSGLGLSISRSIVERLGGRIWAINNAGAGATFLFTLPASPDTRATEPISDQSEPISDQPDDTAVNQPNISEPAQSGL
jgi:PAS domain S-box-containing protein